MRLPHPAERPLALVTGAASGIGRGLARVASRDGYDVVMVARRAERLSALAEELSVRGTRCWPVDILVNDAGVGGRGGAVERALKDDLAMIQLNVVSLVRLTGLLLPGMVVRHRGGILNVASIAGYLPGPGQAVYHATKAFVRSFGLALSEETRGTGVRVTALCPGPVDTEFRAVAGYGDAPLRRSPLMPVLSADRVAVAGWRGLAEVVPDRGTRLGAACPAVRSVAPGRSNGQGLRHLARLQVTHAPGSGCWPSWMPSNCGAAGPGCALPTGADPACCGFLASASRRRRLACGASCRVWRATSIRSSSPSSRRGTGAPRSAGW